MATDSGVESAIRSLLTELRAERAEFQNTLEKERTEFQNTLENFKIH